MAHSTSLLDIYLKHQLRFVPADRARAQGPGPSPVGETWAFPQVGAGAKRAGGPAWQWCSEAWEMPEKWFYPGFTNRGGGGGGGE